MRVSPSRLRPGQSPALVLLYLMLAWGFFGTAVARAQTTTLEGTTAPVVRINVRAGQIQIRTWDRDAVQIDADPSVTVDRHPYHERAGLGSFPIGSAGNVDSDTFLPAESFVPGAISSDVREAVIVRSDAAPGASPVVVTIPNNAPLVFAIAHGGPLDVRGYRGGTLIGSTTFGRLSLENTGGTVFVQSFRGPIVIGDSNFDRIRARSLSGNVTFERCVVHQIETTTVGGSIVFDGGSFAPGLARFESTRGDVAIGSEAAAEVTAHSASGRIYSNFLAPSSVQARSNETHATIHGGGPLVTAASRSGNVYLYDGSLKTRELGPEWQMPTATLERPGIRRDVAAPSRPNMNAHFERPTKFRALLLTPRPDRRR